MAIATITSYGKITIPQEIRTYLHLHTGDKLEFIIEENGKVVLESLTIDVRKLKGILPKPKTIISVKQMNKAKAQQGSDLGNS